MALATPPRRLTSHTFLSLGATGWVYQINDQIVVKYPRDPDDEGFARELKNIELLGKHSPCPHVVQSFLCVSNGIFMPCLSGGTLDQRLRAHQKRTAEGMLLITKLEPTWLVQQWALELSSATAWLESIGLVHGDMRPPNLLLDSESHLKLTDFDSVVEIGEPYLGSAPPWARLLGPEAGSENGSFGLCGARTEQFAIGSVLYLMTRGYEPYELECESGPRVVTRLRYMEFPNLGGGQLDGIIGRCWRAGFGTLQDLQREVERLPGVMELPQARPMEEEYRVNIREECRHLVREGLLSYDRES